jgi:hypothetical protein
MFENGMGNFNIEMIRFRFLSERFLFLIKGEKFDNIEERTIAFRWKSFVYR